MSFSSTSKSLQRSDLSQDNSDEYIPSETTYTKRSNYKRTGPSGDRSGDGKNESDIKKSHHASCHRCGNIRRKYTYCESCPQVYCTKCMDKMIEEHGSDCFKGGCPVCKKLCCCSEKSMNCPRKYHCYKKCLTTKKGIKKANLYHNPTPISPISSPTVKSPTVEDVKPQTIPAPTKPSVPPAPLVSRLSNSISQPFPTFPPAPLVTQTPQQFTYPPPVQGSIKPIGSEKFPPLYSVPSVTYGTPFSSLTQRITPDVGNGPAIQSFQSISSLRYPVSHMNSEDPFMQPPLLSRESGPGMGNGIMWDPSMCQLQRAPDSVQVLNNSIYDTSTGLQPRLLPIQRANSTQSPGSGLTKKTSLSSRPSLQRSPYSDSIMRDDIIVWGSVPSTSHYAEGHPGRTPTPVPIAKQPVSADINTEVCFDGNSSENEGMILLPTQYTTPRVTATSTPAMIVAPTTTATPLARSLSTEVAPAEGESPVLATRVSTDLTPDVPLLKMDSVNFNYRL